MSTTNEDKVQEILDDFDHIQARRYRNLEGRPKQIATAGIIRHIRATRRMNLALDSNAIREIIEDAIYGRAIFAQNDADSGIERKGTPKRHRYNS